MREPSRQQVDLARDEQRSENDLVVLRQPERQVDIEVVCPLMGVSRGQIGQRTAPMIGSENQALERDDPAQHQGGDEAIRPGSYGDGHDAGGKECPHNGMKRLDSRQDSAFSGCGDHDRPV